MSPTVVVPLLMVLTFAGDDGWTASTSSEPTDDVPATTGN